MKSTALLEEDHRHILRVLNVLEEMAARAKTGQVPNKNDVSDVLEFLQGFGDRYHQGKEESVLFRALLRDRGQTNYRKLCALIFEHNRQRSLIEGLQDSTVKKTTKEFIYYASHLAEILRTHIQQEQDLLFPLVDLTLSPSDDERVFQEMNAYDQSWQDKELSSLLHRLDSLESKYVKKSLVSTARTA